MAILCWPPVTNWLFSLWAMSKTGSSWWRHMLAGGRNNEHWTSSKKRENVPPLHCDGVPYVTLVNADEDIMLMLLVIMLSFYFCEIFLKQWPTTPAPSAPGPSDQPFPLQGLSDARFPSSHQLHTPILTSPSFKCWGGGSGGSSESEAAELHEARVGAPVQVLHLLAGLLIICGWFGIGKGELNRKYL